MACAWAVMQHLGVDGYVDLTRTVLENADRMREGISSIEGLRLLGAPRFHLLAMATDPASPGPIDVFALGDALAERGWYHDRQGPPESLHATVSNTNTGVIEEYVADLVECAVHVRQRMVDDRSTGYSTVD
jgi:glutamate/tyrosine decarboxylase-like PLP-dependent enzyme